MGKMKQRWAELTNGHMCLVSENGQILARALKGLDGTFKYKDAEFIDAHSVMTHIELEKGEPASAKQLQTHKEREKAF
jgi:hypothetical protein